MNALERGVLIASAVASLVASGSLVAWATDKAGSEAVHCAGINECKGHGACAGAGNACKTQNACKGQGWVETSSAKECTDKGGKIAEAKKE
ncbi:MAG: BufA2 family periplasmic bufferin-type metallophore [Candidatus Binatia bacterium]